MPSRIATDPVGDPGRLKALLLRDPSVIEAGFRVLDAGLKPGAAGTLDFLAVDRAGQLAIVALAEGEPDGALRRLLDQYLWARDQYDLLARACTSQGLSAEPNVRSLLLAGSYSFPFLRRLDLLAVEVTPYLVQTARFKDTEAVMVRPALEVFRLPSRRAAARVAAMRESMHPDFAPATLAPLDSLDPVPEFPLPADPMTPDPLLDATLPDATLPDSTLPDAPLAADPPPGEPLPGEPFNFGPDMFVLAPAAPEARATAAPGAGPARPDDPFEPLSAEELGEFEQFDRQRRERDRRSS